MSELALKIAKVCVGEEISDVVAALSGLLVDATTQMRHCTTEQAVDHILDDMNYVKKCVKRDIEVRTLDEPTN